MQRWECLSVHIGYRTLVTPDPGRAMTVEGRAAEETGPIGDVDAVLDHYGGDGWELVGLIDRARENFSTGLSRAIPRSAVSEYRATRKRPRP